MIFGISVAEKTCRAFQKLQYSLKIRLIRLLARKLGSEVRLGSYVLHELTLKQTLGTRFPSIGLVCFKSYHSSRRQRPNVLHVGFKYYFTICNSDKRVDNNKLAGSQPSFSTSIWRCLGFFRAFYANCAESWLA
jgi:hypothetical protein